MHYSPASLLKLSPLSSKSTSSLEERRRGKIYTSKFMGNTIKMAATSKGNLSMSFTQLDFIWTISVTRMNRNK